MENLVRLLADSHTSAGQHSGPNCSICKVIESSRSVLTDILDRRRADRVTHLIRVEGNGAATGPFTTRISDLSTDGAFLDSVVSFPDGTTFTLRFTIGSTRIEVTGEVCYSIKHVGMGVRFLDLSPEHHRAIDEFVRSNEKVH